MSKKKCCRTCEHCGLSQAKADGWCRLRGIRVHPEVAVFAFCHHWTQGGPCLPRFQEPKHESAMDLQLEFNRVLVESEG